ncbi:PDZ domain-containing protein [Persicimonas caeni]|nr:PDZ domain-containing protein [Persicimonas caeni]
MNDPSPKPSPTGMRLVRFATVGLIAASAAWFVNELAVWQLERHAPKPPAPVVAAATPNKPEPPAPAPAPVAPEIIVEHEPSIAPVPAPPSDAPVAKSAPEPSKKTHDKPKKRRAKPARKQAASKQIADKPTVRVFTVDKQKLKSRFKKPSDTAGHGHVVPNWVDGERRGMKFADVAAGGIFARLGIQNGDVVMSVNGIEITTQQKALADLKRLRNERTFDVVLQRDGKERRHRYILK